MSHPSKIKHLRAKLFSAFVIFAFSVQASAATTEITVDLTGFAMTTSVDLDGNPVDAVAVFNDEVLNDDDLLMIPALFTGNAATTTLTAFFNDNPIEVLAGVESVSGEIGSLLLDVSAYRSQTGTLKLVLHSSTTEIADLFILDEITGLPEEDLTPYVAAINEGGGGGGGSLNPLFLFLSVMLVFFVRRKKHQG
jgi:hypothetical protein